MNNFLICLIGFGLLAIPCLILAISFGDTWREKLFGCAVICVIWLTMSVGCAFGHDVNAEKWNGGYCKCGTHWECRVQKTTREDPPWDFFGRNDAKAETPVLWPTHVKS